MIKFRILKNFFGWGGEGLLNWIRKEPNGCFIKSCHNQFSHSAVRSSRRFLQLFFSTSSKWSIKKTWDQKFLFTCQIRQHHCIITKPSVSVCIFPYSDRTQGTRIRRKNKVLIVIADIFHCYSLLQHPVLE